MKKAQNKNKRNKTNELHQRLMKQGGLYAKWHKHPAQSAAQWVILLAVVIGVGYYLVNSTNNFYALL